MVLVFQDPPADPPDITGHTQGRPLSTGDNLTCTVRGGKPLVAMILFHCINPQLDDEPDVRLPGSVSSPLTVNTSLANAAVMTCVCLANWGPDNNLYSANNHAVVKVTVHCKYAQCHGAL